MDIVVAGINHKTAPIDLRERLAVPRPEVPDFLCSLTELPGVSESVVLSTCNRVELWCAVDDPKTSQEEIIAIQEEIIALLEKNRRVPTSEFRDSLYFRRLPDSVGHLFRVVCSLDSMVIGESQILGQVKDAYRIAQATYTTGRVLSGAFERAFSVAKKIRTETEIGKNPVSAPSVAVQLAQKVLGDLRNRTVLILGAGKIGTTTARSIVSKGAGRILVANRSRRRAEELAQAFSGETVAFEALLGVLPQADLVIACTDAPSPVLRKSDLRETMAKRRGKPMFLIDLAVPRDIDPKARDLNDLYLYDIDSLQEVAEKHSELRCGEIRRCEEILSREVRKLLTWLDRLDAETLIRELAESWDRICREETQKTLAKLSHLPETDRACVERLAAQITKRLRHIPIQAIKTRPGRNEDEPIEEYLRRLLIGEKAGGPVESSKP